MVPNKNDFIFDKTDSILFTYETRTFGVGASESPDIIESHTRKYERLFELDATNSWQIRPIATSITEVYSWYVQLTGIHANGRVIFNATSPRADAPGTALDEISVQSKPKEAIQMSQSLVFPTTIFHLLLRYLHMTIAS